MKRACEARKLISGSAIALTVVFSSFISEAGSPQSPRRLPEKSQPITFSRDIAPIVFRSCSSCHHAGEAGPFPLVTYGDVKSHARQIADVTRKRLMPPWLPSGDGLRFEEDSHLSEQDIALFQMWVDAGMPEGNSAEAPADPKFTPGWKIGKQDLVLQANTLFSILANSSGGFWD